MIEINKMDTAMPGMHVIVDAVKCLLFFRQV